jgi:hypothetical protein
MVRTPAEFGGAARDLRIDFFRGLALYMIIFDHIPGDPLSKLTYARLGFSDAAEIFVFLSGEEPPQRPDPYAPVRQPRPDPDKGDVRCLGHKSEDHLRMRLDPLRTAVAALRPRLDLASRADPLLPADRTRRADAEPLGCLAARHSLGSGIDDPAAKISGKGFGHAC